MELANLFTEQVRAGAEEITAIFTIEEQAARQFAFRRRIVHAIVFRVDVKPDKTTDIYTEWQLSQLCGEAGVNIFCGTTRNYETIV